MLFLCPLFLKRLYQKNKKLNLHFRAKHFYKNEQSIDIFYFKIEKKIRSHLKNATRDNSFRKNTSFVLYKKFHEMASTQNE